MGKLFIAGAHLPNGGAYMAYHVGLCASALFDLEPIAVTIRDEQARESPFSYQIPLDSVPLRDLQRLACRTDISVINPSFSEHMLGLDVKGKKLCYTQGFNTFQVLDGFFDLYVSASQIVQQFLATIYRMNTKVIHPFIEQCEVEITKVRTNAFFLPGKGSKLISALLAELEQRYLTRYSVEFPDVFKQTTREPHKSFLESLRNHAFFLTLSPCEGFGLMPLEAMNAGCIVAGFDGGGGREYMKDGYNSAVTHYPDLDGLVARIHKLRSSTTEQLDSFRTNAIRTSAQFTKQRFYKEWRSLLIQNADRLTS
jgi:hypothetical protein